MIQVAFGFVLCSIYYSLDRMSHQNPAPQLMANIESWKKTINDTIKSFLAVEPELIFLSTLGLYYLLFLYFLMVYARFKARHILAINPYNLASFLLDPDSGSKAIDDRLKSKLDHLIMSNLNHTNRLRRSGLLAWTEIERLSDELEYLFALRRDTKQLWPKNRLNQRWFSDMRFTFFSLYVLYYVGLFSVGFYVVFEFLYRTTSYQRSQGLMRTNFWVEKFRFELLMIPAVISDWFAIVFSTLLILLTDKLLLFKACRQDISRFNEAYVRLMYFEPKECDRGQDIDPSILNLRANLKTRCNRLALELYLRWRYCIDASYMSHNYGPAEFSLMMMQTIIFIILIAYSEHKRIEGSILVQAMSFNILVFNILLLVLAFHYKYWTKEFNRTLSVFAASVLKPLEKSEKNSSRFDRLVTTSHTHLLWLRMICEGQFISKRFGIHLFKQYELDYALIIKINGLISCVIMFYFIYRS